MTFPVIFILGPTASGKSALGLRLAEEFGGCILNCDSLQTYRRLDIGTAKPTLEERARVPHFLFDVVSVGQILTAGDFRRLAMEILAERTRLQPVFAVGAAVFIFRLLRRECSTYPSLRPRASAACARSLRGFRRQICTSACAPWTPTMPSGSTPTMPIASPGPW
ncbi:MAG: hypothetical protein HC902_08205 [Calothrix sp. SM1_5_4]|nr:hypothetical protein [Calothrix sp. SM1_5_4]